MPEFSIKEFLKNGLRPESWYNRNVPFLDECKNAKPTELGVIPPLFGLEVQPFDLDDLAGDASIPPIAFDFPFPQIIRGREVTLLGTETALYIIDEDTGLGEELIPIATEEPDVVVNGTFDTDLTGWTTAGTVTHDAGTKSVNIIGAGTIEQAVLTGATQYKIFFDMTANAGQSVTVRAGTNSQVVNSDGSAQTHEVVLTANGADLEFETSAGFAGNLDNIQAFETTPIVAGGRWQIADFGHTYLLTNGSCCVMSAHRLQQGWVTRRHYIDTVFYPQTLMNLKGRLVMGGFNIDSFEDFWKSEWVTYWNLVTTEQEPDGLNTFGNRNLSPRHVWWSSIGGEDMFKYFFPDEMFTGHDFMEEGAYDATDNPLVEELMHRNEEGHRAMPWQGEVLHVKELGEGAVVYTESGVAAMLPVAAPYPTFAFVQMANIGAASRDAVGGDLKHHVFISNEGRSYEVTPDYQLNALGYTDFLDDFVDTGKMALSFDPERREHYISGTDNVGNPRTYIRTPYGLGEWRGHINSITYQDGMSSYLGEQDDDNVDLCVRTVRTDFNDRLSKNIRFMHVIGFNGPASLEIHHGYDRDINLNRSKTFEIPKSGLLPIGLTAKEFELKLTAPNNAILNRSEDLTFTYDIEGNKGLGVLA